MKYIVIRFQTIIFAFEYTPTPP